MKFKRKLSSFRYIPRGDFEANSLNQNHRAHCGDFARLDQSLAQSTPLHDESFRVMSMIISPFSLAERNV